MPTGYTAGVMDGTITEFKDYAFQCARAFGALVTLRDEPMTPDIPTLKVEDYYLAEVKRAEKEVEKISTMTSKQIEAEFLKHKAREIKYHTKGIKDQEKVRKRYSKMLEEAKKFVAPTDEHVKYRDFLISQLEESLNWDCGSNYHQEQLTRVKRKKSARAWHREALTEAKYQLKYARKSLKEEIERVKSRNDWISQLKKAVENV